MDGLHWSGDVPWRRGNHPDQVLCQYLGSEYRDSVSLSADQVENITLSKGKLMIAPMYSTEVRVTSPGIQVVFQELGIDFSVYYIEPVATWRSQVLQGSTVLA